MATDAHGRRIDYLRISLTDRCNLRCVYCMPQEGVTWRPPEEILTYEEIERFARIALSEGISKVRLTGGEPLVRRGLVGHVSRMTRIVGREALALTTNGVLLPDFAHDLARAGLARVNVSIDTLDPDTYREVTRGGDVRLALAGIDAALAEGMGPVKVNVVLMSEMPQDLFAFARMTLDRPIHVRFIERMPIGACHEEIANRAWCDSRTLMGDEVVADLAERGLACGLGVLVPVPKRAAPGGWGPARYFAFEGAKGTVGVISPVSHHFCGECNRLRLTADGRLRPCLFDDGEIDVRPVLRDGTDDEVRVLVKSALGAKPADHGKRVGTSRTMSEIGG